MVSFILTYYNLPIEMLRQCIDSIKSLELKNDEREIILVDDGSDKSPLNQISQYQEDIIYVRQRNEGLSSARNAGISMAKGCYIQFVDADDYLIKHAYDQCLNIARKQEADLIVFQETEEYAADPTEVVAISPIMNGSQYMRNNNLRGSACGYLFKPQVLSELRFTPGLIHEDEEFTPLLFLRSDALCATNLKAYHYRKRPQSIITATDKEKIQKRLNDLHSIIVKLHRTADTLPTPEKTALDRRVAQLTMDYLYKIMVDMNDSKELKHRVMELRDEGLFPLPNKSYTTKYSLFQKISQSLTALKMMSIILPYIKKER